MPIIPLVYLEHELWACANWITKDAQEPRSVIGFLLNQIRLFFGILSQITFLLLKSYINHECTRRHMNTMNIEIYVNDRFHGSITYKYLPCLPPTEEEIVEEAERRLPFLKWMKYKIALS